MVNRPPLINYINKHFKFDIILPFINIFFIRLYSREITRICESMHSFAMWTKLIV